MTENYCEKHDKNYLGDQCHICENLSILQTAARRLEWEYEDDFVRRQIVNEIRMKAKQLQGDVK